MRSLRIWLGAIIVVVVIAIAVTKYTGSKSHSPPAAGATTAIAGEDAQATSLLSGSFKAPSGFRVVSVNPLVPATGTSYGAVQAILRSDGGVVYRALFSPTAIPCSRQGCSSSTTKLQVGDAVPKLADVTFTPDVGAKAKCGYAAAKHEVGCDAISAGEYVSVRSSSPAVSAAAAVAVLRSALSYLQAA